MSTKVIGVKMGWAFTPQLCFENGKIYAFPRFDKQFHPEYFPEGCDWPIDPETGENLPIIKD